MEALLDHLEGAIEQARAHVTQALGDGQILAASDDQVVRALSLAAELQRLTDAVLVESVGEVSRRSSGPDRDLRLTARRGCHDVSELVQRATRMGPASAARLQRGAKGVALGESLSGGPLPALLPALRSALLEGEVGIDGLIAVSGPLEPMSQRVPLESLRVADAVLAAEACGTGPDGAPPACADLLRVQAQVWAAALDQDGAEPKEQQAMRMRGVTLGVARDGVVPLRGSLLPEVAAQFQRICDAIGSPRVGDGVSFRPEGEGEGEGEGDSGFADDPRTSAQKRHDALATALSVAASSEQLPTIGGAAPTLVISVRAEDLVSDTGWAHVDGIDEPVSARAAAHVGCAGVIQRVLLGDNGRIQRIGTEERVFNRHQRRAIALRDGGCIIPGCGVRAAWCEIHHVTDHAEGGPTHTDNGVLLCWNHHRFIDHGGWQIRMNRGVPEVKAPPWIERNPRWRPVTTSRTRLLDLVARRT
ncbi:DUF222 domain-containing protein [Microbacterium sp.]|uniref:HNH endonuclease signature motif containing protein n=1 Tax=Microbacterium sp. TaxID=51671 RepID=UPI0037CBCE8D